MKNGQSKSQTGIVYSIDGISPCIAGGGKGNSPRILVEYYEKED